MAQFQDSGFFGLSARTIWISLAVTGVVVGLFFIPGVIKQKMSNRSAKPKAQQTQTAAATGERVTAPSAARGSLSPSALKGISEGLKGNSQANAVQVSAVAPKSLGNSKKVDSSDAKSTESKNEGLLSGWDFKVKAGVSGSPGVAIPAGLSIDRLSSKEAQKFFSRSRGHLARFGQKNFPNGARGSEAVSGFVSLVDVVGKGVVRGSQDERDLPGILREQHVTTLKSMAASGADRGVLLDWLSLPVVSFVDGGTEVEAREKLLSVFTPRVVLRSVNIRQKRMRYTGYPEKPQAVLRAEIAVKGSDVQSVSVLSGGRTLREVRPPRADAAGYRVIKVSGDATGVWSFVVNDKYGANSYRKSYAFYPRVYRFRQKKDGTFDVGFRPGSAPNSLDRYFYLGSAGGSMPTSDGPGLSRF
jgi:hypothetical protein